MGALIVIAMVALFQLSPLYAVYAVAAAALIWLFHLDNIQRLLAGTERQIGTPAPTPSEAPERPE